MDDTLFRVALADFVNAAQNKLNLYMTKEFPTLPIPVLEMMDGKRYVRIVRTEKVSRSVFCFVDKTNGDILKAAGWKAPAKHARGNIFTADAVNSVSPYGANYLR